MRSFRAARALALSASLDSATSAFRRSAADAIAEGERNVAVASLRGAADLLALRYPCADSADVVLRDAMRIADTGDRTAADALVRLLAARGNASGARQTLVDAYAGVPALGRSITKESMRFLQGQAAIQVASTQESGALATLNQALGIAARLHAGDVSDSVARTSSAVDPVNAWLLFDLGMLRLQAKSPTIRQLRVGTALLDSLANTPASVLDGGADEAFPTTRIGDRLLLRAHASGTPPGPRHTCTTSPRR
jgi:hypothetical protein